MHAGVRRKTFIASAVAVITDDVYYSGIVFSKTFVYFFAECNPTPLCEILRTLLSGAATGKKFSIIKFVRQRQHDVAAESEARPDMLTTIKSSTHWA